MTYTRQLELTSAGCIPTFFLIRSHYFKIVAVLERFELLGETWVERLEMKKS